MYDRLKISHHKHSGRYRPHEYTSYFPLVLLMLAVGLILTVSSVNAASPGPQSGSIGLEGSMPGKPPKTAAVITSPTQQQHFHTSPVTVTGTCPAKTLVEIYKNDIFAGSTPCTDAGTFSIDVDLLIGQNILIARVYDALNQPGPDSNAVTVFYDALPAQADALSQLNFGGPPLLINTDAVYRGSFAGQDVTVPITVIGGTPPFAVNVQWGDSSNKIIPRNNNVTFNTTHAYKRPGTFPITLQATDSQDRVAFITVAAIINGQPAAVQQTDASKEKLNKYLVLWPLYTSGMAIVLSFWLGERREKRILSHQIVPLQPRA